MATRVNMVIDQGTSFQTTVTLTDSAGDPLDVSGLAASGMMRRSYYSINSISFSTSLSNGSLILSLTANQTANIADGRYVYDVDLTDNIGTVTRLVEGIVTINPSVTH